MVLPGSLPSVAHKKSLFYCSYRPTTPCKYFKLLVIRCRTCTTFMLCGVLDMTCGDTCYVMWGYLLSYGDTWYVMWGYSICHIGFLICHVGILDAMWGSWYVMQVYLLCYVEILDVMWDTWYFMWGYFICHVGTPIMQWFTQTCNYIFFSI